MRQVELVARLLEHVGEPLPAVGRLDSNPGLAVDLPEQLQEGLRVVVDPAREQPAAVLRDDRDLGAPLVQVDADRIHPWASFDPDFQLRPEA